MEISNLAGLEKGNSTKGDSSSHIVRVFQEEVDASLTWGFVKWMRGVTQLPIFVKVFSSPPLRCLSICPLLTITFGPGSHCHAASC